MDKLKLTLSIQVFSLVALVAATIALVSLYCRSTKAGDKMDHPRKCTTCHTPAGYLIPVRVLNYGRTFDLCPGCFYRRYGADHLGRPDFPGLCDQTKTVRVLHIKGSHTIPRRRFPARLSRRWA